MSRDSAQQVLDWMEAGDSLNTVHYALLNGVDMVDVSETELPAEAFGSAKGEGETDGGQVDQSPVERLHPLLFEWFDSRDPEETVSLLITFEDEVPIPRFPFLDPEEPREGETNQWALDLAQTMANEIVSTREDQYGRIRERLAEFGVDVSEEYWLVLAVLVDMSLGQVVPLLEQLDDILYIEPRFSGEPPPRSGGGNPVLTPTVKDGRSLIQSDPYQELGLATGWIALLDTGVRSDHVLLADPTNIDLIRDCVMGDRYCRVPASQGPSADELNHGTSSAAIMCGNTNKDDPYRGVGAFRVDSFKVYPSRGEVEDDYISTDRRAVLRAFEQAVLWLNHVIVAEMQGLGSDTCCIALAADKAFDSGRIVVAANGNTSLTGRVKTPANAHKAIGVGSFLAENGGRDVNQLPGPAPDNRVKPDIQAPTGTHTASSAATDALQKFGATSGATPYAAAAAGILRNWLRRNRLAIDPGHVYARLILCGQRVGPFGDRTGAGPVRLQKDGLTWWGKVQIPAPRAGVIPTVDIPITIQGSAYANLDAALWWPESASQAHNHLDLCLIPPGSTNQESSSKVAESVFQRARVSGAVQAGTWKLQIRGTNVQSGPQVVYWAAQVGNQ